MTDLHRRRSSLSMFFPPGIFTSSRNTFAIEFTIASPRFAIATPPFKVQLLDSLSESHLDSQLQLQLLHSTSQFFNSQSHLFIFYIVKLFGIHKFFLLVFRKLLLFKIKTVKLCFIFFLPLSIIKG
jgi:hypothetical protein